MFPAALAIVVAAFPRDERGKRDGDLLRHRRRADRDRPARRRLPDRDDLAGDLLDQRPGRDRRPDPDLRREAGRRHAARRRSTTAAPCSPRSGWGCSVLGLQQSSVWGWDSAATWGSIVLGADHARRLRPRRARHRAAADAAADLRRQGLRGRQRRPLPDLDRVRAAVPLRQHVRADLARLRPPATPASTSHLLRRLRDRRPVGRADARPRRRAARRSCSAARSPRSASTSGRARCPTSPPARIGTSGSASSSPAPGPGSSSARPTPTRSTGPRARATAR